MVQRKPEKVHKVSLTSQKPKFESEDGSIQVVNVDTLPILKNMSIKRLILKPGAIREPHWHVNAHEMAYCLRGDAMLSILDTGNSFNVFTLAPGEMYHILSGSLHHIENVGEDDVELIIAFRHEKPLDFSLAGSMAAFTPAVLGNTFDNYARQWEQIKPHSTSDAKDIVRRKGKATIPDNAKWPNPHKFDVEGLIGPTILPKGGSAKTARSQFWPALQNFSMYSLRVEDTAMREPHWHPITGEMGYVHKGEARMTVLDPDGSVDTYILQPGDVYFIPAAYPHHIECTEPDHIHFLIFFDQAAPQDVGFRTGGTLISPEVMAASLQTDVDNLPKFPFVTKDPLLVYRKNPVDP